VRCWRVKCEVSVRRMRGCTRSRRLPRRSCVGSAAGSSTPSTNADTNTTPQRHIVSTIVVTPWDICDKMLGFLNVEGGDTVVGISQQSNHPHSCLLRACDLISVLVSESFCCEGRN